MEISKVHTWLQVGVIVGGFIWGAAKVDSRLDAVENGQQKAEQHQTVLLTAVNNVENNQMSVARAFDDISNNLLFHKFTDVDHILVTDPSGTTVKLVIAK